MTEDLKDIQDRLTDLSEDMETYAQKLRKGEAVDLTALQSRIGDVSVDVVNARPESTRFLSALKHLVVQLDALAVELKQHRDKPH
jgi:hypothetical protein